MTTYTFQRNRQPRSILDKGQWRPFGNTAVCRCPKCGEIAMLDHAIAEDGTVTPSLVCPNNACDFHEWVKLGEWAP